MNKNLNLIEKEVKIIKKISKYQDSDKIIKTIRKNMKKQIRKQERKEKVRMIKEKVNKCWHKC